MRGSKKNNLMISTTNTSSNCFSSILQRLACGGNLASPTLYDQRRNLILPNPNVVPKPEPTSNSNFLDHNGGFEVGFVKDNSAQPGLVARLMGLESMPNCPNLTCPKDSIMNLRSKSLNSLHWYIFPDTFLDHVNPSPPFLHHQRRQPCHRRTQTSSSVLCVEQPPSKEKLESYSCSVEDSVVRKPEKRRRNGELSKRKKVEVENKRNNSKKNDAIGRRKALENKVDASKCFIRKDESARSRMEIKYKDFGTKLRKERRECRIRKDDQLKLKVDEKRTRSRVSVFEHCKDSNKDDSARRRRRSSRKNSTGFQGEKLCRRTRKETKECSEGMAEMSRLAEEYVRGNEWINLDEDVKELGVGFAKEMFEVLLIQFLDELMFG